MPPHPPNLFPELYAPGKWFGIHFWGGGGRRGGREHVRPDYVETWGRHLSPGDWSCSSF